LKHFSIFIFCAVQLKKEKAHCCGILEKIFGILQADELSIFVPWNRSVVLLDFFV